MGMDRPGTEPSPSRMLSGCDTTTPTAPELSRPRVLKYLLRIAFSAEAVQRESFASRACAGSREEKERNQRSAPARLEAERAGPHSFAHSENQPKECAGRKEAKRPAERAVTELQR